MIWFIAGTAPALAEATQKIEIAVEFGQAGQIERLQSKISIFRGDEEVRNAVVETDDNRTYFLPSSLCTEDTVIVFKVSNYHFFRLQQDRLPCASPSVIAEASSIYTYAAYLERFTPSAAAPAYGGTVSAALAAEARSLTALGSVATDNQRALIAALEEGDFGSVAFYANENAYLAHIRGNAPLASAFAALSFDAGYRAMGLDPASTEVPLIAPSGAPVLTDAGRNLVIRFNSELQTGNTDTWGLGTVAALRDLSDPGPQELIALESLTQIEELGITESGRFFAPPM